MEGCGEVVTRHVSFRQRTGGRTGGGGTGPCDAQPPRSAAWLRETTVSTQVGSRSPKNQGRRRNLEPSDSNFRHAPAPAPPQPPTPSLPVTPRRSPSPTNNRHSATPGGGPPARLTSGLLLSAPAAVIPLPVVAPARRAAAADHGHPAVPYVRLPPAAPWPSAPPWPAGCSQLELPQRTRHGGGTRAARGWPGGAPPPVPTRVRPVPPRRWVGGTRVPRGVGAALAVGALPGRPPRQPYKHPPTWRCWSC